MVILSRGVIAYSARRGDADADPDTFSQTYAAVVQ
jgi:hypothetical protein